MRVVSVGAVAALGALASCVTTLGARGDVPAPLSAIPIDALCVTSGRVDPATSSFAIAVRAPAVRAVVAADASRVAELAFTYIGPTDRDVPLASGEIRRQLGLKLRAQDTCNVVYVMWHIAPTPGVFVSVKRNPGQSKHAECGDRGYVNVRPIAQASAPTIAPGTTHRLRAELEGRTLRVFADGARVWTGELPEAIDGFDGPAGIRSDGASYDAEMRVPGGARRGATCRPIDRD